LEIQHTPQGVPYKLSPSGKKQYQKDRKNTFGTIYFVRDEELSELNPVVEQMQSLITKLDKMRETLSDLVGSKVQHHFGKDDYERDREE